MTVFFSTTPNPSSQEEGTSWQGFFTRHSILTHPLRGGGEKEGLTFFLMLDL